MSTFSERLKEISKIKNLTQKQIAIGTDMAERQYQFYEYGKREPTISTFKKFCTFLDVSADYLLGLSDDPTRH